METLGKVTGAVKEHKKPIIDLDGYVTLKTFCIISISVVLLVILFVDRHEIYDHFLGFGDDTLFVAKIKAFSAQPDDWNVVCKYVSKFNRGEQASISRSEYNSFTSLGLILPEFGSHETVGEMVRRCNDFYLWTIGYNILLQEKKRLEAEDAVSTPQ